MLEGRAVGVFAVCSRRKFAEHAFKALESLASEIALGIARKQAQEDVNHSRERCRIAAPNASDLIWQWDPAADQIRYFGSGRQISADNLPASSNALHHIVHPADRDRVIASLKRSYMSGEPFAEEYRICQGGGEIRYWSSRATLLRGDAPNPDEWIGVSSDITDKKHREA